MRILTYLTATTSLLGFVPMWFASLLVSSAGKESACNAGNLGSILGVGRSPGGGHGNPLQYSCLENLHRQRSLHSPWSPRVGHDWATTHSTAFVTTDFCCWVTQSYLSLCDPMDCSQASLSMEILQARILKWVDVPFSRESSQPRDQTQVSHIAGRFFTIWATRETHEYWSGWPIPSPGDLPDPRIWLVNII